MPTTDRTVLVRIKGDASDLVRAAVQGKAAIASLGDSIDKTNDRTAWLAQGVLALAPAVTTLGAGAVPVLSGLATQMTVGAAAAGVMALGFNGIGDSLSALNDYQLDPTAENLEKLNEAMDKVGESGESFVRFLDHVGPQFAELSNAARGSMFPGIEDGIRNFMVLLPQVERIVSEIGTGIGEIASSAGADLAGPEWQEFWDFLESDARPILVELSNTIGNFAQGMGSLIAAFAPLTRDFSSGFEGMSRSFADWAATVDETEGFRDFLAYVREAAPLALDFLGSLVMAFAEIVEAAAPVGVVMLPALTKLLDVIGELADTPLGPIVLGFTALTSAWGRLNALAAITGSGVMGKALGGVKDNIKSLPGLTREAASGMQTLAHNNLVAGAATDKMRAQNEKARSSLSRFGRVAGGVGGQAALLGFAMSDVDDKMGLTNTTMLTLAGSMAGPWGAAIGAAIGLTLDLSAASRETAAAIEGWQAAMESAVTSGNVDASAAIVEQARAEVAKLRAEADDGFETPGWLRSVFSFGPGTPEVGADDENLIKLEKALAELEGQHNKNQTAADNMGAAIRGVYTGMSAEQVAAAKASGAQKRHAAALEQVRAAARDSAEAFVGLGDKLDKGKVSLDDWIKDLQKQADALRNFRENAQRAAERGLNKGLIKALNEAGPAGAMRMKQLADGTEKQIDRANEAWKSQRRQVELFGNALGVLPNGKRVDITVTGLKESIDDTHRLYNALADIRSKTVTVTTVFTKDGRYFKDDAGAQADGGTIGGARHPYGDKLLTWLAPGEEVISNRWGQADRHRDLLKAINANRLADGGTIGHLLAAQPSVNVAPAALSLAGARFVLEVPGMGQVMTRVVRSEMAAEGRFRERLDDRD